MQLVSTLQIPTIECFLDPSALSCGAGYEHRIYGDDMAQTWAVVDEEDYAYFSRWRWCLTKASKQWRRKAYMRRQIGNRTLYLHVCVMERSGEVPPTHAHVIVDHWDGNSLNCRLDNFRWATCSENARNLFGSAARQLELVA